MSKEITIEGIVYIPKEEVKVDNSFPQKGDKYWYLDSAGLIFCIFWNGCVVDTNRLAFGNCHQTEEAAQHHSLRIESLSKGFVPDEGGKFWVWWWYGDGEPYNPSLWKKVGHTHLPDIKHRTKEACLAWYKDYGESWLYFNK